MRPITSSAKFYLVQKLQISNKEAFEFIMNAKLLINGIPAKLDQEISVEDEVTFNGELLQKSTPFQYYLYNKPVGIECTLNTLVVDNLKMAIADLPSVYPVGRLDKASEGLLLLTNDGKLCDKITYSDYKQEKEYWVQVDQVITKDFLTKMESGVEIMGKVTKPAKLKQLDVRVFTIILTQGLNRQIRRMCYKLGYQVEVLRRVRIINLELGNLPYGQYRTLTQVELQELKFKIYEQL